VTYGDLAVDQDPKTVPKESRNILGRSVLEKKRDDTEEGTYGRADRGGTATGGSGGESEPSLSEGGDQRSDVLCLEKTVREAGCERTT